MDCERTHGHLKQNSEFVASEEVKYFRMICLDDDKSLFSKAGGGTGSCGRQDVEVSASEVL